MVMKYLHRAMSAITPKSAYEKELAGRRAYFREEQRAITANNERVKAAMARGDVKEALQLAQPGLRQDETPRELRLEKIYAEDDALFARVEREHELSQERLAVIRAQQNAHSIVTFADTADQARYAELCTAGKFAAAAEFRRERIAAGLAVETVQR